MLIQTSDYVDYPGIVHTLCYQTLKINMENIILIPSSVVGSVTIPTNDNEVPGRLLTSALDGIYYYAKSSTSGGAGVVANIKLDYAFQKTNTNSMATSSTVYLTIEDEATCKVKLRITEMDYQSVLVPCYVNKNKPISIWLSNDCKIIHNDNVDNRGFVKQAYYYPPKLYCEANSAPSGWESKWKGQSTNITWGVSEAQFNAL